MVVLVRLNHCAAVTLFGNCLNDLLEYVGSGREVIFLSLWEHRYIYIYIYRYLEFGDFICCPA